VISAPSADLCALCGSGLISLATASGNSRLTDARRAGRSEPPLQPQQLTAGGREILVGVLIFAVYLYGAVGLPERLAGYVIMLLGGLASAALPYVHTARPLGERFGQLPGGFFFIWTLLTMGGTGLVAFVLSVQAIQGWRSKRNPDA
jgi:hypothetical protein